MTTELPPARFDTDDLGEITGPEQDTNRPRPQRSLAPVSQDRIIQHTTSVSTRARRIDPVGLEYSITAVTCNSS